VGHGCVRLKDILKPVGRIACAVADLGELGQVFADLSFVPGQQDRVDVGEVPVERRAPDARALGDLRHRH
jgi:hypothetical protein